MQTEELKLIQKIFDRTSFLFLGQNYLGNNVNEDLFLKSILKKYLIEEEINTQSYDEIFKINFNNELEEKLAWTNKISQKLSPPKHFDKISNLPWSGIYTSSIDSILIRAFENDWRTVQTVFHEDQIVDNPRSRHELKINYLFGSVSQPSGINSIPINKVQKSDRLNRANKRIEKLPEILTTNGLFFIEGYNPEKDWLHIERFYSVLNKLGDEQVHFFSFIDDYRENDFIQDLIGKNKIVTYKESLINYINATASDLDVIPENLNDESVYGKWLNIKGKRIKLPRDLKTRLIKSAIILDDSISINLEIKNNEHRYNQFKKFLSSGNSLPYWPGYSNNFAFERTFVVKTVERIRTILNSNSQNEDPIIIYGQSSSGKTIGLGHLAHYLSTELEYPTLFIPRTYTNPNDSDLDHFCEWAEKNSAKYTFILWDGMNDKESYYSLQSRLNARGRKVFVIGTQYKVGEENSNQQDELNFIEANIELDSDEKSKLHHYLEKNLISSEFISQLILKSDEKNFLSILYRYLPDTQQNIQNSLISEIDVFSKLIIENSTSPDQVEHKTRLSELLTEAGLVSDIKSTSYIVDNESFDLKEQFINYIMVPGRYGISVPFELLLRCLGTEIFYSSIFKELKKTDIIKWSEDKNGNIFLEPRTAIEAEILSKMLGSNQAQVEIIKNLILHLNLTLTRAEVSQSEDSAEINFAVELLKRVGPNSQNRLEDKSLLEIAETLEKVRLNLNAYHPRLVLQEVSFYREIAKEEGFESKDLLQKSEELLSQEIDLIEKGPRSNLETYFRVELASTLGTKIIHLLRETEINKNEILSNYNFVKNEIIKAIHKKVSNYYAIDVLLWTTRELIESGIFSEKELIKIEAELFNFIDFLELEGIDNAHREKFLFRKLEVSEALNNAEISEEAFQELENEGSTLGYYIRTRRMVSKYLELNYSGPVTPEDNRLLSQAYDYLKNHEEKIFNDSKTRFLEFRIWWLINAKNPLFAQERAAISFNSEQWTKCLFYTNHIKTLDRLYESPTILYQEALAYFHLGKFLKSEATFTEIDAKSDFSSVYGSKRIKKFHLASSSDGKPINYSGEAVESILKSDNRRKSKIFVHEIRRNVTYMLNDFRLKEVKEGQRFTNLYIGFNFRGPIILPEVRVHLS